MRALKGSLVAIALLAAVVPACAAEFVELVMYRRAGCPYCAAWDREIGPIYPKTEVGKKVPLRHVHLDRGRDNSVALKSPIRFTPTFIVVEDGREKARIEGYSGEFFFWGILEKLLL